MTTYSMAGFCGKMLVLFTAGDAGEGAGMGRSTAAADLSAIPIMPPLGLVSPWDPPDRPPLDGDARARVAEGEDGDAEPHREGEGDDGRAGGRAAVFPLTLCGRRACFSIEGRSGGSHDDTRPR